jgi:hypothetical protein
VSGAQPAPINRANVNANDNGNASEQEFGFEAPLKAAA